MLGQMSSSLIWKASALGGVLGGTSNKLISVGGGGGGRNDWLSSNTLSSPDTPLLGNSSATGVTVSCAVLLTEPYWLVAVQQNKPPSSGNASAITNVQISSGSAADLGFFCRMRKSGESWISRPSRNHWTRRGRLPLTRHSRTTTCPSDACASCNILVKLGGALTRASLA